MAITIVVNGESISYPQTGDTGWGGQATEFAEQTASAFGALGLSSGTTVDIPGTLDVTGATTLDSTLTVAGTTTLNGNNNLGNASSDTTAITGILNVDSGVLYVDPATNKVGINDTTPSVELDVNGAVAITGNETVGGTLGVTGDVAVNTNKFNVTASSGNTTIAGTLGVSGNTTIGGVTYLDDDTTANTPVLSFTGDTNTGIGRSAADTIDLITGGISRAKLNSTGQQSSVVPDLSGSNTNLFNEYKCRAWVFANASSVIQKQGNVDSITDHGTGDYQVNFLVAMPDANYAESIGIGSPSPNVTAGTIIAEMRSDGSKTASAIRFTVINISGGAKVDEAISLMVFR
jgi:hypothetical protein